MALQASKNSAFSPPKSISCSTSSLSSSSPTASSSPKLTPPPEFHRLAPSPLVSPSGAPVYTMPDAAAFSPAACMARPSSALSRTSSPGCASDCSSVQSEHCYPRGHPIVLSSPERPGSGKENEECPLTPHQHQHQHQPQPHRITSFSVADILAHPSRRKSPVTTTPSPPPPSAALHSPTTSTTAPVPVALGVAALTDVRWPANQSQHPAIPSWFLSSPRYSQPNSKYLQFCRRVHSSQFTKYSHTRTAHELWCDSHAISKQTTCSHAEINVQNIPRCAVCICAPHSSKYANYSQAITEVFRSIPVGNVTSTQVLRALFSFLPFFLCVCVNFSELF